MAKKDNIKEVARRYATALYELADAAGEIKKISLDLKKIDELFANEDLKTALSSPIIAVDEKLSAIYDLTKKLSLDAITQNFLLVVTRNGRIEAFAEILAVFNEILGIEADEVSATLISASPVEASKVSALQAEISRAIGKKIKFTTKLDPKIIGGLIVQVGSTIYDYSVKSRLAKMKQELAKAS